MLLITSLLEIEIVKDIPKRATSAFIVVIMWMKMFDWLRMFDQASKYVSLIHQTLSDIMPFFGIFIIFLFMFGSAMFILNSKSDDTAKVIASYVNNDYVNMIINQYLLSLGEYDQIDNYN